ncbi:FAD/NAD(P)-binding domain-containing protein [Lindgomyces ingoldianus]|uniref:FAD/NAD(P)-binding domain-containing protein n=1 Tax=Lindgomyces ingoldianus TaxID=673940 RepID=A0ACB6REM6_9PLEO|nr:FAD/NAD(P)-binding domain-containing protein [Lindgomyces ingoldianus]KAF2477733.1 FAD/NAD(P)-binding domain-containing protein [Lindgomyces ingoldianus]
MASIPKSSISGTEGDTTVPRQYDVIVVGAGFSGISNLHRLRNDGLKVHVFEAGSDFGGVWYWNRYPGARVDSETPFYQLNIPSAYKSWNFSSRFPDHRELRKYMAHLDSTLDLRKDVSFNSRVNSATWNKDRRDWTVTAEGGETASARWLILATGLLHRRHYPEFPGLKGYKGVIHHSGFWPEDLSVKGKKVAIIGAGATSVQIVQELAKEAGQLTMLMRRPSYCLPMGQRKFTEEEQTGWKGYYPSLFSMGRNSAVGFPTTRTQLRVQDVPEEEREGYFEEIWGSGGFQFLLRNYSNVMLDKEANKVVYDFWKRKIRERLTDPGKQALMAPDTAPYYFGTKRCPLENDYYEMLNKPNVSIIDLNVNPISTFTPGGIQLSGEAQARDFDYVILATGFDSFTGSLTHMGLKNKDGVDIKDVWKDGVKTYLGMMIHGFPNAFMVYSPQAPTALSNGPTILEAQTDFICDTITSTGAEGMKALTGAPVIEPTLESETEWKDMINAMNQHTLYPFTSSWWTGGNIPGKKAENMTFVGGIDVYERECRERMKGWRGWDVAAG